MNSVTVMASNVLARRSEVVDPALVRPVHTVEAPEAIEIRFDLAGIGSRFIAGFLDHLFLLLALGVLALVGLLIAQGVGEAPVVTVGVPIGFALVWFYFLLFEGFWGGQTPGKRIVGIRVIRKGGAPIGAVDSAVRNLARFVDFLPAAYGLGVIVMFVRKTPRRLGDLAAGTVVVKERRPGSEEFRPLDLIDPGTRLYDEVLDGVTIEPEDHRLAREFLRRAMDLDLGRRAELAHLVAFAVAEKIGIPPPPVPERFLLEIALRERRENHKGFSYPS
jgi:uncharacterized RDD family membrane protein YckC